MANKNITQLTPQVGSANTTSLLYAVTGGNTDTSLPLSVFVNNLGLTGIPTTPTASTGTNTTQIASTAFVQSAISGGSYAASFLTLQVSGQITSTVITGTAPFVVVSTTNIPNLNASLLNGTTFAAPGPIGSTTASSGSFTSLIAAGGVSGSGFQNLFASPYTIGNTTPASGRFTTISTTSTITPSTTAGIVGTTVADNANAGSIGEYIVSDIPQGSAVVLTSGTAANVTSISLTAGDWDVTGVMAFVDGATTTRTYQIGGVSTTSATLPANEFRTSVNEGGAVRTVDDSYPVPVTRINISSTTTVYLVVQAAFGTSTSSAYGVLRARRMR